MPVTTAGVIRGYQVLLGALVAVLLGGITYSLFYLPTATGGRIAHTVLITGVGNYAMSLLFTFLLYPRRTNRELRAEANSLATTLFLMALLVIGSGEADFKTPASATLMAVTATLFIAAIAGTILWVRCDRQQTDQY